MQVAVAMSGGIDSLRTAVLLKEQGNDVFGIHMRLLPFSQDGNRHLELLAQRREEALKSLVSRLGIPLVVVDMSRPFEECVIRPFLDAYQQGLTPNPCVLCNPKVKFGPLLQQALSLGADRFATGHYANILPPVPGSDRLRLFRANDVSKDQSYFLFGLTQEQLAYTLFPLGTTSKREVTQWAHEACLLPFLPEESQEICFIPSGDYGEFLQDRLDLSPSSTHGPILDMAGNYLGEHKGIFSYTIGQRRGLGIASTEPYYVIDLEPETNTVRVGRANDLYRYELHVEKVNWVSIPLSRKPFSCQVRIRNQHQPAHAWLTPLESTGVSVRFKEPQRAVTPGQAAVFYDGGLLLGGGIIMGRGKRSEGRGKGQ